MRFKASRLTAFVLELDSLDIAEISSQIANDVQQAPQLFLDAPLVLKINQRVEEEKTITEIVDICRTVGLTPMAIDCETSLPGNSLSGLSRLKADVLASSTPTPAAKEAASSELDKRLNAEALVRNPAKIIDKPVRSGQQVYAKDTDLIVLGNVGAGAEVIADGCVHVYGALRGRAIAGATGDESARIFCQQLDAELLSIAGTYILKDAMNDSCLLKTVAVSLKDKKLELINL